MLNNYYNEKKKFVTKHSFENRKKKNFLTKNNFKNFAKTLQNFYIENKMLNLTIKLFVVF